MSASWPLVSCAGLHGMLVAGRRSDTPRLRQVPNFISIAREVGTPSFPRKTGPLPLGHRRSRPLQTYRPGETTPPIAITREAFVGQFSAEN